MTRRKWPLWRKRERNYVHGFDHSDAVITPKRRALIEELAAEDTPIRVTRPIDDGQSATDKEPT